MITNMCNIYRSQHIKCIIVEMIERGNKCLGLDAKNLLYFCRSIVNLLELCIFAKFCHVRMIPTVDCRFGNWIPLAPYQTFNITNKLLVFAKGLTYYAKCEASISILELFYDLLLNRVQVKILNIVYSERNN